MKKILLVVMIFCVVILVLLFLQNQRSRVLIQPTSTTEETQAPEILGYITNDQVGIFKVHAPVPSQESMSKMGYSITQSTYVAEGDVQNTSIISKNGKLLLTFDPSRLDTISNIRVHAPEFTTNNGISTDSTVSDFIQAYPNYRLWYTSEEGENFIFLITKDTPSPQFMLKRNDLIDPNKSFYTQELKISDFKADARISEIRIY